MGWLTRLLGYEGLVRVEGTVDDGRTVTAAVPISCIGVSQDEVVHYIQRQIEVKYGVRLTSLKIVDMT